MHEFSICQNLVDAVVAEMEKIDPKPARLLKARVVVGEMRQVVPEFMEEAYKAFTKGTIAKGSTLEIKHLPIAGRCKDCGWRGEMPMSNFVCQKCGSAKTKITGGMELYLDNLEIEES